MSREADAVVLDVEGTTSATGFVVDVLYPHARERFGALLAERSDEQEVARALAQVRTEPGEPDAGPARIGQALKAWLDEDRKVTPLKTLQGLLWAEGFARGELVSHLYADVVPALRRWRAEGLRLYVYSSGSVAAQRACERGCHPADIVGVRHGNGLAMGRVPGGPRAEVQGCVVRTHRAFHRMADPCVA